MYTLGIESSCDETSCAILKDFKVLSNITLSSLREHSKYGGVIPEIATRAHLKNIDKVLNLCLEQAKISLSKIDLIAVTYKPGLIGALVIGLEFAKALAIALKKPFVGVNHLHAHLFGPFLNNQGKLKFPFLGLVVSGGHTDIYQVNEFDKIKLLGQTCDDACGEVYDKVARMLGLGYPGGPLIDKMFDEKYKNYFKFNCGRRGLNLSFSGLKTAVLYQKMELEKKQALTKMDKIKLASSFQETAVSAIEKVISEATYQQKIYKVACGGGVIANKYLRQRLMSKKNSAIDFLISPFEYSMDNAAMVAGLGFYLYNSKGKVSNINLNPEAN